jgi:NodT family efflux transporter outer membrane factor (OMF) lipoprotein
MSVRTAAAAGVRRARHALVLAGLMPSLAACIPSAEKPVLGIDIPAAYLAGRGKAEAALPKLDWWRGFRSRQLTALMEEAQSANFDIAVAIARILQADAQAQIAGAPLLPAVNLDARATRSQISLATGSGDAPAVGVNRQRTLYNVSLNASYEIDFWGKNRATLLAAEETAVAARFNREVVALSTLATVGNGYFQVLGAQDRLRIARENLSSASRILVLIRQRTEAGTANALDLAQQEALVATTRASIPPLEQTLRQNIAALAVLVGKPPEYFTVRGGGMMALAIPAVTPGLPSDLLTQRPDIRMAETNLESANASVVAARAAFFPSIQLTADGGYQSAALRTLFTPQAAFYNATASLTQPIFDGFRLQGQFDFQRGRQEELVQTYRKTVIQAFADVENALIAVQQTAERERLQREAVVSSRRAFELSEARLREGAVDLVTVLNAQQTLFQNEDALSQARLARLQAIISLFQALGGGWAPQEVKRAHAS